LIEGVALTPRELSSYFFASAAETVKAIPDVYSPERTTVLASITDLYKQLDRINLNMSELRSYFVTGEISLDSVRPAIEENGGEQVVAG
jgi:hypothetical protein